MAIAVLPSYDSFKAYADESYWNNPIIASKSLAPNAAKGALTGAFSSGSSKSEETPWSTILTALSSSALEAERNAAAENRAFQAQQAAAANAFSASQAQKAMDFEAAQAALNRSFQQSSADKAMAFEAEQSALNRSWQEQQNQKAMDYSTEMSNTQFQRTVRDLKAAGLNPILAYANQNSSPSGVSSAGNTASGYTASGSSGSGHSASGVAASGSKANSAAGKNSDLQALAIVVNGVSSVLGSALKLFTG